MAGISPYRVDGSAVLKTLLLSPSSGWPAWLAMASGVVLAGAGALFDVRFVLLGLMMCVAVAPSIVVFLYFSHALSPGVVPNLLPHTLDRSDDGYVLRIWRKSDPEEAGEEQAAWVETGSIALCDANIVDRKTSFEYEMLYFINSRMKILYVPRY